MSIEDSTCLQKEEEDSLQSVASINSLLKDLTILLLLLQLLQCGNCVTTFFSSCDSGLVNEVELVVFTNFRKALKGPLWGPRIV